MNEEQYAQIEEYINGQMGPEQRQAFESALASDRQLAETFHLYSVIEKEMTNREKYDEETAALKRTLQSLDEGYRRDNGNPGHKTGQRRSSAGHRANARILRFVIGAAACLVLFFCVRWLYTGQLSPATATSPQQLAERYTKEHLLHISQTMGLHPNDSLQQAASAYNNGEYNKALPLLEGLINNDSLNTAALNFSGRTYLMTKQFDKALLRFESLASKKGSFSNPGKFLQAVTLLQRNTTGDVPHAKQLLQEVVSDKEEGSKEAAEWLTKF